MNPKLHHHLMRGTPIAVDGRVLVPEARVTTLTLREATFGTRRTRVAGMQFSRVRPTALIERTLDGERTHRIEDVTGRALLALGIAAVAAPVILSVLVGRPARLVGKRVSPHSLRSRRIAKSGG